MATSTARRRSPSQQAQIRARRVVRRRRSVGARGHLARHHERRRRRQANAAPELRGVPDRQQAAVLGGGIRAGIRQSSSQLWKGVVGSAASRREEQLTFRSPRRRNRERDRIRRGLGPS
jgi:hypothetical protein